MPDEFLFQDQFRALVTLVSSIEAAVKARVEAGGKGVHMTEVRQIVKELKLNRQGQEIFYSLLIQSDVVTHSEDKRYLVPCISAIDAEYEEKITN